MHRSFLLSSLLVLFLISIGMTDAARQDSTPSAAVATVHIVYTEKPESGDPEAYHIRTLTSVLGSEEAAREALIFSYRNAASGFSAKLTPEQVAEMSKQPGVLDVEPSRNYQLQSGSANLF